MCLQIPGKVIEIKNDKAIIDYEIEKREGKIMNVTPKIGDYVIVQAGFILDIVEKEKAESMLNMIKKND